MSFLRFAMFAVLMIQVSANAQSTFSSGLSPYPNITTSGVTVSQIITNISNPNVTLSTADNMVREQVVQMYLDAGIDISYDYTNDDSVALRGLSPTGEAPGYLFLPNPATSFSPDAPYYHTIPTDSPRVLLPAGYIQDVQVNSARGTGTNTDGIGYGEVIASASDPNLTVRSMWPGVSSTLVTFPYHMPMNWYQSLPTNSMGDRHMIFIDPQTQTFVSSYKTRRNTTTYGPNADFANRPTSIIGLGDQGGSTAAKFAELPAMIQPWELTDTVYPIFHGIGGPVARVWGGRVYPASARDTGMLTGKDDCAEANNTYQNYMNTGLVPYGGVIQLDPSLDLTTLGLSLPAFRLLQAMQTYGYYVMDFGCTDFDVYTAIDENEIEPYGGMYGNANGVGVQNEVKNVLINNRLYVVPPMVKH
jgi:hypothetical protein